MSLSLQHALTLFSIFTIGFAGVQDFAQVTVLRFFIGVSVTSHPRGIWGLGHPNLQCRSLKLGSSLG